MKPLTITDPSLVLALQDEIRRSEEARYDHRLHAVLLVAQGQSCLGVAKSLGDSLRSVQYWTNRFEKRGFAGLQAHSKPLWAEDEVHFQQYGSRCRMWAPPEVKEPILLHHPTRKSVGYFGAVNLRSGKMIFQREEDRKMKNTSSCYICRRTRQTLTQLNGSGS